MDIKENRSTVIKEIKNLIITLHELKSLLESDRNIPNRFTEHLLSIFTENTKLSKYIAEGICLLS